MQPIDQTCHFIALYDELDFFGLLWPNLVTFSASLTYSFPNHLANLQAYKAGKKLQVEAHDFPISVNVKNLISILIGWWISYCIRFTAISFLSSPSSSGLVECAAYILLCHRSSCQNINKTTQPKHSIQTEHSNTQF